jgi:hypothetical protein
MASGARRRYAAAARLFAAALESEPARTQDRRAQYRYEAACSAAAAGTGHGEDDPRPGAAARTAMRRQALEWLRAELTAWAASSREASSDAREDLARALRHWKSDPALSCVREAEALTKLPPEERTDWKVLWSDVDALLARATPR